MKEKRWTEKQTSINNKVCNAHLRPSPQDPCELSLIPIYHSVLSHHKYTPKVASGAALQQLNPTREWHWLRQSVWAITPQIWDKSSQEEKAILRREIPVYRHSLLPYLDCRFLWLPCLFSWSAVYMLLFDTLSNNGTCHVIKNTSYFSGAA